MHYGIFIVILILLLILETVHRQFLIKKAVNTQQTAYSPTLYLIFIFLGAMAALRAPIVGNDTQTYLNLYQNIVGTKYYSEFLIRYEIGYVWLNRICGNLSKNPQTIIIVSAIITTLGYLSFFKKYSKSICLSIIMFVCLRYYDQTLNVIRECIAICIILFSFKYIVKRKFIPFSLCIASAFLFHKTAIVFMSAWWISKLNFNKKNFCLLLLITITFTLQFGTVFQQLLTAFETYSYYDGGKYFGETRIATLLTLTMQTVFFGLSLLIRYKNRSRITDLDDAMLLLWFTGICILLVSTQFNLLDRIATYFNVFSLVVFPNMISKIRNYKNRRIINFIIVIFLFLHYIAVLEIRPDWNRVYPFEITSLIRI